MGKKVALSIISILFVCTGCVPSTVWRSTPIVQNAENEYYEAQLEPLTRGHKFFVSFRLSVTNRTHKNLEIDWNMTRYIHNGRTRGGFVFKGIKPEDIGGSTIPPDAILAGVTFSKVISPFKMLARPPLRDPHVESTESTIYPGILPTGENGILLVIRQNGKEVVERITLTIVSQQAR
ncbi:MAG: hypothetical protein JSU72_20775 [Deltaproteobacteria bacterium]|nr:MAG: hypothetical protein JSU72_20775 [Deltaproteobacteria bacterium]